MIETTLKRLIAFKTLSADHRTNLNALKWFYSQVEGLPLYAKWYSVNKFPSLLLTTRKTLKPKILLAAHMDVVNGSSGLFRPRKIGSKLYGRGAFDMKFAIATYLKLLNDLGSGLDNYNIGVLLTTDEEPGGQNGTKAILAKGLRTKFCIIPDGGFDWKVEAGAKGIIQLNVESYGKSAHGSRVWQGQNAIDQLYGFVTQLKTLFPNEPCGIHDHQHGTLNLGQIAGGLEANTIPNYAEAKLNIRFTPETTLAKTLEQIKKVQKKFPRIRSSLISGFESYQIIVEDPMFQNFIRILEQNRGQKIEYIRSHGTCDARYFAAKKIATVSLRPKGGGHHSEQEWIDLKSLDQFYQLLKTFVITGQ